MFKKKNLSIFLLLLPLFIAIGFSTWIIVYEIVFIPEYVEQTSPIEDISKYYDVEQSVTYNGYEQNPIPNSAGETALVDKNITYHHKLETENDYVLGSPINAGVYDVKITAKNPETNEDVGMCVVKFTINKANPILTAPTVPTIYEGQNVDFIGGLAVGVNDETLTGTFSYTNPSGTAALSYSGTGSSSSNVINFTWIPTGATKTNYNSGTIDQNVSMDPVAYIGSSYYGTIEKALSASKSGDTVYVIISNDMINSGYPVIKANCEVKSGVTLTLPYEGTSYENRNGSSNDFADVNASSVSTNMKINVHIAEGVVLTNNGTIRIGGIVGNAGQGLSAQTSGSYSQITLSTNASIVSNGTILCLGYIKEESLNNGSMLEVKSGTVTAPFVIYDYRGGTNTVTVYRKGGIAPFSVYDMPNIQVIYKQMSTATLEGYVDLYASSSHNTAKIKIISSSSAILNLSSGAYIVSKYTPEVFGYTKKTDTGGLTNIKLYNGASGGSMSMKINGVTVKTDSVYFGISWKYSYELYNGTYDLSYMYKFMTGSSLYVDSSAILNLTGSNIFYQTYEDVSFGGYKYPSKPASLFVNNGKVNVSGTFAGVISTTDSRGYLNISTTNLSVTPVEGNSGSTASWEALLNQGEFVKVPMDEIVSSAYLYSSSGDVFGNLTKMIYYSTGTSWREASDLSQYTINYNANGGTLTGSSSDTYPIEKDSSIVIESISTSDPIKEYYTFCGWYLDADCTIPAIGSTISANNSIAVFAKWELTVYRINYVVEYQDCESNNYINNSTSTFIYTDTINIVKPTDDSLNFYGWYADPTYTMYLGTKENCNFESISSYLTNNEITLYGYFSNIAEYTVTFDTNNPNVEFSSQKIIGGQKIDSDILNVYNNQLLAYNTDTGYNQYFVGWYSTPTFDVGTEFTVDTVVTSDLNLYAKWENKLSISYYDYKDSIKYTYFYLVSESISLIDGLEDATEDPSAGIRIRYIFKNWIIDDVSYAANESIIITKNIEVKPSFDKSYYYMVTINTSKATITCKYKNSEETVKNGDYVANGSVLIFTVQYTYQNEQSFKITDKNGTSTIDLDKEGKYEYTVRDSVVTAEASSTNTCIVEGTLITMADGTQKKVEDIKAGDYVKVFNHETGKIDTSFITINVHDNDEQVKTTIMNLMFDNGQITRISYAHGFFDVDLNEYVYINMENYLSMIGHRFYTIDGSVITLADVYITEEYVRVFSPITYKHFNIFADNMLSMAADLRGINIFELDDEMKIDIDKMNADIEKYGLYTYDEWSEYLTFEIFDAFNVKYLKVAIGKGLVTEEEIKMFIELYF